MPELRIDDHAAGHQLLKRLTPAIASTTDLTSPAGDARGAVALSSYGLKALGAPQASLESFSPEFQQEVAARAAELGDVGESAPENWEWPLGTSEVHLVVAALAPEQAGREQVLSPARQVYQQMPGVTAIYRQDCYQLSRGANHLAFGTASARQRSRGAALLEAILRKLRSRRESLSWGIGRLPAQPQPEVLGRNGSYVALRKLHQDVAEFRRYLAAHTSSAIWSPPVSPLRLFSIAARPQETLVLLSGKTGEQPSCTGPDHIGTADGPSIHLLMHAIPALLPCKEGRREAKHFLCPPVRSILPGERHFGRVRYSTLPVHRQQWWSYLHSRMCMICGKASSARSSSSSSLTRPIG